MDVAAQHGDLMRQYQDLHLVGAFTAHHQDRQVQQLAQDQIPERRDHGLSVTTTTGDGAGQTARQNPRPGFRTVQVQRGSWQRVQ
jgi:hypothetical protein